MSNIVTELESLNTQFTKYEKILIPQYQRSYAWESDNVQTFWEDIKDSIVEKRSNYFIGPIVSKSVGDKAIEIIDGQQRITTSLTILGVIKRICLHKYNEDKDKNEEYSRVHRILNDVFLVTRSLRATNCDSRYKMNEENQYIYENFIVADESVENIHQEMKKYKKSDSNFKLLECISTLWELIFNYTNYDLDELTNVAAYVLENLQVLNMSVADESDAYLIFETINDRGRELDSMDLVKNLLFSKAGQDRFNAVKDNWVRMSENLSSISNSSDFLYSFWTSFYGKSSKQNLFKSIKDYINNSPVNSFNVSRALVHASKVYSAISNPSDSYWDDFPDNVRASLRTLKELSAKAVAPLIISAVDKFSPDEFDKLLNYIIVFQVRYVLVCEYHTGKYSNAISEVPAKINSGNIAKAIKVARELKEKGIYVNDQEFRDALLTYTCTTKKAKMILASIEGHVSGGLKLTNPSGSVVNIEHLVPQTRSQFWNQQVTNIENQEYETWVNRLGNMFLVSKALNKELKSSDFSIKKTKMHEEIDQFLTSRYVVKCDSWGKAEISGRQEELTKEAIKLWRVEF